MEDEPDFLAKLVADINRGAPGIANRFHEEGAMNVFVDCCQLDLPWRDLRRGDAKLDEPDAVIESGAKIIAGFELTEIEDSQIRRYNAMLARKIAGEPLYTRLPKDPEKRRVMLNMEALVERTHALVASGPLEKGQHFLLRLSEEALVERIVARIEAKKRKPYHQQTNYPVHLVIYERDLVLCDGEKASALRQAGEHGKGNFAGVWYLEDGGALTRL